MGESGEREIKCTFPALLRVGIRMSVRDEKSARASVKKIAYRRYVHEGRSPAPIYSQARRCDENPLLSTSAIHSG